MESQGEPKQDRNKDNDELEDFWENIEKHFYVEEGLWKIMEKRNYLEPCWQNCPGSEMNDEVMADLAKAADEVNNVDDKVENLEGSFDFWYQNFVWAEYHQRFQTYYRNI